MTPVHTDRNGFSLLELLLALAVGCTLVAVIGGALLGELGHSGRLAQMLRERAVTERALELMRMELQEASAVHLMPGQIQQTGCGLSARTVILHLDFTRDSVLPERSVTYSVERKPDSIWRGQALMRCGPSYGLDGQMETSDMVSRVFLDGLDSDGLAVSRKDGRLVAITLIRRFGGPAGKVIRQVSKTIVAAPGI